MKYFNIIFYLVCLFLTANILNSQQIIAENKINENNIPSTIIQKEPSLFFKNNDTLICIWDDYRKGDKKHYAQIVDINRSLKGVNFEVYGKEYCNFIENKIFSSKLLYYYDDILCKSIVSFNGRFQTGNTFQSGTQNLGYDEYGTCGTGLHELTYDQGILGDKVFSVFSDFKGLIKRTVYNATGLLEKYDTVSVKNIEKLKVAVVNNSYGVFWISSSRWEPTLNDYYLYATFFNGSHQTLADSVPIIKLSKESFSKQHHYTVRRYNDSLYYLIYLNYDASTLDILKFNNYGEKYFIYSIDIKDLISDEFSVTNFNLTNPFAGKSDLIFSISNNPGYEKTYIYGFNESGEFTGLKDSITSKHNNYNNSILKIHENKYLLVYSENDDVFVCTLQNFIKSNITKLNDDLIGSNEENIAIYNRDNASFLSVWKDEAGIKGRVVSLNGLPISGISELSSEKYYFNNSNPFYYKSLPTLNSGNYLARLFFNNNFVEQGRDTIKYKNGQYLNIDWFKSYMINNKPIFLYKSGQEIKLSVCGSGNIIERDTVLFLNNSSYIFLNLLHSGDSVFYLNVDEYYQKYDVNLNKYSTKKELFYGLIYLGQDRFLSVTTNYVNSTGEIYTANKDTLADDIVFCTSCDNIKVSPINKDNFAVSYRNRIGNKLFFKIFSTTGRQLTQEILVAQPVLPLENYPKILSTEVSDTKLITTWSEARSGDYDIYTKIFELSPVLSDVQAGNKPTSYALSQNYPNPFNPTTTIEYEIPIHEKSLLNESKAAGGFVSLRIYDILGRVVETLVSEIKPAGRYSVKWDARNYSSGIFFYELKTEEFRTIKKMLLIK